MKKVVVAGYARSPFTLAKKGELATVRPDRLAAQVVAGLVARTKVNPDDLEDLLLGCAFPEGEQGLNMARLVAMMAGLPQSVAGQTINRFCGSSMQSIHSAAGAIQMGAGEAFICAGIESMSRVPMMGYNVLPDPDFAKELPGAYIGMGDTAENVAKRWGITRDAMEAFAVASHVKATAARAAGKFEAEIVSITDKRGKVVSIDGCIRPETTAEGLATLKPAFSADGVVTAGTSSPLTDGASAVLVCSLAYAEKHGLEPLAKIRSIAVSGCDPEIMGIGPVGASLKAAARAGIDVKSIDVVELNEAFASQSLACIRDLGLDAERVNIDGGAIALGHPLGATGAMILGTLLDELDRRELRYGLATLCVGGGMGIATIVERVA